MTGGPKGGRCARLRATARSLLKRDQPPEYEAGLNILLRLQRLRYNQLAESYGLLMIGADRQRDDEGRIDPAIRALLEELGELVHHWNEEAA